MMEIKKAILFTALIIAFTAQAQEENYVIDQIVAKVGKNIILQSDVETQYAQMLSQGQQDSDNLKCEVFEEILTQKLMVDQAAIDSVKVTAAQVDGEISRRLSYFIQQLGSEERLEQYYQKSIADIKADFRASIEEQLLVQQMEQNINGNIKVTPSEVKNFYLKINQDSLPLIPEEVEVNQIIIKPQVTKEQKQLVKERLESFKTRILKGEDFETLAVLYSDDPGSSAKGGELGFLGRGVLVPEFEQVAFSLKNGELSKVIETQFGFHLIQGISRRGEQVNVRHILLKVKVSKQALETAKMRADSISKLISNIDSITFATAVLKYSEDEETKKSAGTLVNTQSGTTKFTLQQLDPALSLVIDKMKIKEISEPFLYTEKDGAQEYRIVQLKSRTKAHKANIEDDYSRIQAVVLANKKNMHLHNWILSKKKDSHIEINPNVFDCQISEYWKTN